MNITSTQIEKHLEQHGVWNTLLIIHVAVEEHAMLMRSGCIAGDKAKVRKLVSIGKKLEALMREAEASDL